MSFHGGNRKRKAQLNKKNGSRSKTSSKNASYRVYCSYCGVRDAARPSENSFVVTAPSQHFYTCNVGHRGVIGGHSYSGDKPFTQENKRVDELRAGN